MILLDTNVLSALMRDEPDAAVVSWLDQQPAESIWTTSITVFEVRMGLALLPVGRRQRTLLALFEQLLSEELQHRVLDFDSAAATCAAELAARRQRAGQPVDLRDTQIAGIALARHAAVATRNVRHFGDMDVPIIDPWAGTGN